MSAKTHPYIVVDQNQMRSEDVISAAVERCRQDDLQLLIADVFGFESSKGLLTGGNPFTVWKHSLKLVAAISEHVVVGRKLKVMWDEEIKTGKPSPRIIDDGASNHFRELLHDVNFGNEAYLREFIEKVVNRLMPASLEHWSNHEEHKTALIRIRDWLKPQVAAETIKALRDNPAEGVATWLSSKDGTSFVLQVIKRKGLCDAEALRLAAGPSVYAGYLSGMAAIALYWLGKGGLDSIKPTASSNDLHDLDYGILGALSHSLVSEDQRCVSIHEAIKAGYIGRQRLISQLIQDPSLIPTVS